MLNVLDKIQHPVVFFSTAMLLNMTSHHTLKNMLRVPIYSNTKYVALEEKRGTILFDESSTYSIETSVKTHFASFLDHIQDKQYKYDGAGFSDEPPYGKTAVFFHLKNNAVYAIALYKNEPSLKHYDLLKVIGVTYKGGQNKSGFFEAYYENSIQTHINAGLHSSFSNSLFCNKFFYKHGNIDNSLKESLEMVLESKVKTQIQNKIQSLSNSYTELFMKSKYHYFGGDILLRSYLLAVSNKEDYKKEYSLKLYKTGYFEKRYCLIYASHILPYVVESYLHPLLYKKLVDSLNNTVRDYGLGFDENETISQKIYIDYKNKIHKYYCSSLDCNNIIQIEYTKSKRVNNIRLVIEKYIGKVVFTYDASEKLYFKLAENIIATEQNVIQLLKSLKIYKDTTYFPLDDIFLAKQINHIAVTVKKSQFPDAITFYFYKNIKHHPVIELKSFIYNENKNNLWSFSKNGLPTAMDTALLLMNVNNYTKGVKALEIFENGNGYIPQICNNHESDINFIPATNVLHWCEIDIALTTLIMYLRLKNSMYVKPEILTFIVNNYEKRSSLFISNPLFIDYIYSKFINMLPNKYTFKEKLRNRLINDIIPAINEDGSINSFDIYFSSVLALLSLKNLQYEGEELKKLKLFILKNAVNDVKVQPFYASYINEDIEIELFSDPHHVISNIFAHKALFYEDDISDKKNEIPDCSNHYCKQCIDKPKTHLQTHLHIPVQNNQPHSRYFTKNHEDYVLRFALPNYIRTNLSKDSVSDSCIMDPI